MAEPHIPTVPGLNLGGVAEAIEREFAADKTQYIKNPIGWVRKNTGGFLWSKQRAICRSVVKHRYTAVPSCHDSGKSFVAAQIVAWWIDAHPPGTAFAVTTAPTTHQVDAILWREIGRAHRRAERASPIILRRCMRHDALVSGVSRRKAIPGWFTEEGSCSLNA